MLDVKVSGYFWSASEDLKCFPFTGNLLALLQFCGSKNVTFRFSGVSVCRLDLPLLDKQSSPCGHSGGFPQARGDWRAKLFARISNDRYLKSPLFDHHRLTLFVARRSTSFGGF